MVRKMKKQGASGEAALNQNELQDLIKFGAADLFAEVVAPASCFIWDAALQIR